MNRFLEILFNKQISEKIQKLDYLAHYNSFEIQNWIWSNFHCVCNLGLVKFFWKWVNINQLTSPLYKYFQLLSIVFQSNLFYIYTVMMPLLHSQTNWCWISRFIQYKMRLIIFIVMHENHNFIQCRIYQHISLNEIGNVS